MLDSSAQDHGYQTPPPNSVSHLHSTMKVRTNIIHPPTPQSTYWSIYPRCILCYCKNFAIFSPCPKYHLNLLNFDYVGLVITVMTFYFVPYTPILLVLVHKFALLVRAKDCIINHIYQKFPTLNNY